MLDVAQELPELGLLAVGGDGEAVLEVVAAALGADLEPRRRTGPANRTSSVAETAATERNPQ